MFDRRRTVMDAAAVGYLLCGFLVALTSSAVYFVLRQNPYRLVRDWDQLLLERGQYIGFGVLAGLLLFLLALAGWFVLLAVAARAARLHPTAATLAGLLLTAAAVSLAVLAVRTGLVASYAALQYRSVTDEVHKHALLVEAYLGEHTLMLAFWSFLGFAAPGLFFLGRALRGETGWLPDALRLSAALILLHLPATLYLAYQSLLYNHYAGWLAGLDQFLLWGGLAFAFYCCARWLRAVGRTLPG